MPEPIYKTGHQSADDPFEFVMSDETQDRMGDVISADGWDLKDFRKNPVALYGHNSRDLPIGSWKNVRLEGKRLIGKLQLADEGTSPFIDTIRKLLVQRHLKAVSVGFLPSEAEPLTKDSDPFWGPFRYLKQALMECSVVSVPANPNALALAKSLSPADRARLFAEPGSRSAHATPTFRPAEPGTPPPNPVTPMNTIAERISAAQDEILTLRNTITPLATKIRDGDDLTPEEQTDFDRLTADIGGLERNLGNLRSAENVLAGKTVATRPLGQPPAPSNGIGAPAIIRAGGLMRGNERPFDLLVKMGVCHLQSRVLRLPIDQVRSLRYPDRDDLDAVFKTATNPAMTTVAGWAAELVSTAIDDFLELLRPNSVYVSISSMGVRFTFGRNGVIKIPRRTGSGSSAAGDLRGAFVGEGDPIPVRRAAFSSVSLTPRKMGVISHFTREMAAHSTPAIESIIRNGMVEDTAIAVDQALLDNQVATVVRPAGLLNGVTPSAGTAITGGAVAAIQGDITLALTPFVNANAATGLVWIVNPSMVNKLIFASTSVGVYPFKADAQAGNIAGYPFIASTLVPATHLTLVRAADFASATGDEPEFDVSDTAVVHEEDGTYATDQTVTQPTSTVEQISTGAPGSAVVATPVRSFWQTATIGIRMLLDMDWAMRRSGMVSQVGPVTW